MQNKEITEQLILAIKKCERYETALRTIYDNCSRQPRDHLVHSIMATIEANVTENDSEKQRAMCF